MVHGNSGHHEVELNRSEKLILELVRRNDGISRSSLVSQTILNQSSVHRIVDTLTENGFLSLGNRRPREEASPARHYRLMRTHVTVMEFQLIRTALPPA